MQLWLVQGPDENHSSGPDASKNRGWFCTNFHKVITRYCRIMLDYSQWKTHRSAWEYVSKDMRIILSQKEYVPDGGISDFVISGVGRKDMGELLSYSAGC